MTLAQLKDLLVRAGVPRAHYREDYEYGETHVFVGRDYVGDAQGAIERSDRRAAGQVFVVKRLWFWRRWWYTKLL